MDYLTKGQRVRSPNRLGAKTGIVVGARPFERKGNLVVAVDFDGEAFTTLTPVDTLDPESAEA